MSTPTSTSAPHRHRPAWRRTVPAYAAFAAFGTFWGTWGAALPAIRTTAGLDEGQLGTALLFVGAGALPAMLLTGRFVDRWRMRIAGLLLALLGVAGLVAALGLRGPTSAILVMLLIGVASGASDVAINTLAGHTEHQTARAVLTRAHGVFSLAVVGSSLGTGALLTRGSDLVAVFTIGAGVIIILGAVVHRGAAQQPPGEHRSPTEAGIRPPIPGTLALLPLLIIGVVGALAYATENAHQSWGAVLVTDAFAASPQWAALAPATFAAVATVTRLGLAPLSRTHPYVLLVGGGLLATAGSALVGLAPTAPWALGGLALAAAGTATLFPTLLSHGLREIAPELRGRATSTVTTAAYLGFLLGPAYVGLVADALGLRYGFLAVGLLALVFSAAALPAVRWAPVVLTRRAR